MADRNDPFGDFSQFARTAGIPDCSGLIKQELEDFQVDEILGFEPHGVGEHLYLKVRKQDHSTTNVAKHLAEVLGSRLADVGYSGMKDRRGVCTQWFSVPKGLARDLKPGILSKRGLELLEIRPNERKLRRGSHRANHFRIRVRQFAGKRLDLTRRAERIRLEGIPNYFGPQRLGRGMSNVYQAQEYYRTFDEREVEQRLPRSKKSMLLSATRSFLFNKILSRRVLEGSWNRMMLGEVINLEGSKAYFKPATSEQQERDQKLEERLAVLDIHPTGLLAGIENLKDPYLATDKVAELEAKTVARFPDLVAGLTSCGVNASRRALRLAPTDLEVEFEDEDTVVLSFTLIAGGYATAVLRELVEYDNWQSSANWIT